MIDRAIAVAGIGIGVISGVLLIAFPAISRKVGIGGLVIGVLLLGAAGGLVFLPDGNAQSPSIVNQAPGSAFSYGQQGGVTAGTINIAPSRAAFTEELGRDLLLRMRTKKPVALMTVGGTADQKVGDDVQEFLVKNGFNVERRIAGVLAPPPDHPFSFYDNANNYGIVVAPSAR